MADYIRNNLDLPPELDARFKAELEDGKRATIVRNLIQGFLKALKGPHRDSLLGIAMVADQGNRIKMLPGEDLNHGKNTL